MNLTQLSHGVQLRRAAIGLARLAFAAGLIALAMPGIGEAANPSTGSPSRTTTAPTTATASFEGRPINLATSWQAATSCIVATAKDVRCFRTAAAADAAARTLQITAASD